MRNKLITVVLTFLIIGTAGSTFSFADSEIDISQTDSFVLEEMSDQEGTIVIQSGSYVWKYKRVGGVMFKRLYNVTTHQWAGEWIKC